MAPRLVMGLKTIPINKHIKIMIYIKNFNSATTSVTVAKENLFGELIYCFPSGKSLDKFKEVGIGKELPEELANQIDEFATEHKLWVAINWLMDKGARV